MKTRSMALAGTSLATPARAFDMDHQDGNLTGLYLTEEEAPGELPVNPIWYEREPNSYGEFGGNFTMTTRKPITRDRQYSKGDVSDNNPTGVFTEDLTPNNLRMTMQGFLYADAREKPSTRPMNGTAHPITGVDGPNNKFTAAAGMTMFLPGHLVYSQGFFSPANNRLSHVTAVAAGAVTVAEDLVADASPASTATVEAVGFQFGAGGCVLSLTTGRVVLTIAAGGILALNLNHGEWIGVGGDTSATRFADSGNNAPFYGRISHFDDTTIEFDKTTGVQTGDAGAGKTIQIFFGTVVRNEDDPTLIKERTYTLERQYGSGAEAQSEAIEGWTPNQLTITIPTPGANAKVTVEQSGIARRSTERTSIEGVMTEDAGASVVAALNEPCFKPGIDVYQHKLAVIDETTLNPTPLVAFSAEATLVVNNNVSPNKSIETFGNASVNLGEFTVTGTLNAYWQTVEAARRVRQGANLTWHLILTKANGAVVFDIASLGLGNARSTVEANAPVRLPLDSSAGKGKFGYTLLTTFLRYVPTVLLAQARI